MCFVVYYIYTTGNHTKLQGNIIVEVQTTGSLLGPWITTTSLACAQVASYTGLPHTKERRTAITLICGNQVTYLCIYTVTKLSVILEQEKLFLMPL